MFDAGWDDAAVALYSRFRAGEVSPEEMVAVLPRIWRSRSALDPLGNAAAWRAMVAHAGHFTWRSGQLQGRRARRPWRSRRLFRGAVPDRRLGMPWTADPAIAEHFARYRQPLADGEGRVWTAVQVHRLLAKDSIDERIREIQDNKRLLFDHFARRSEAKEADSRSVDTTLHRPEALDDESIPMERRVLLAEQHRLGMI